jgi:hypothetical protein
MADRSLVLSAALALLTLPAAAQSDTSRPLPVTSEAVAAGTSGACASCTERNGSGINQVAYVCARPPILGENWTTFVAVTQFTQATYVAIGAGPTQVPILGGELLIDLSFSVFLPGRGEHVIPIPNDAVFLGVPLYTQGFRVDRIVAPALLLLNAQDAVIGLECPR